MTPNQKMKLIKDLKDLGVVVLIALASLFTVIILMMHASRIKMQDENTALKAKLLVSDDVNQLIIDSIKTKYYMDSLIYVDSINRYKIVINNQAMKTIKHKKDETIALIPNATSKQRDSLWTIYSPKN